jgi:hypothetical protein
MIRFLLAVLLILCASAALFLGVEHSTVTVTASPAPIDAQYLAAQERFALANRTERHALLRSISTAPVSGGDEAQLQLLRMVQCQTERMDEAESGNTKLGYSALDRECDGWEKAARKEVRPCQSLRTKRCCNGFARLPHFPSALRMASFQWSAGPNAAPHLRNRKYTHCTIAHKCAPTEKLDHSLHSSSFGPVFCQPL